MNLRLKFVFSIGLFGLLCLLLSSSLRAETIYTYTGNTFTACTNVFVNTSTAACQGAVDISFETSLIGSQLYNLSNFDIAGSDTLLSFSADDGPGDVGGVISCGFGCMSPTLATVQISTNAVGDITAWSILGDNTNDRDFVSSRITSTNFEDIGRVEVDVPFGPFLCGGVPCISVASVSGEPGTWTAPVGTPEPGPGTLTLIEIAFLGMAIVVRKRITHRSPQA
jgi:hypothetical protein